MIKRHILIIEDNTDIARLVQMHLRDAGYSVDIAIDGETGLQHLEQHKADLLILDLMLPGMDGLAVCRELRGREDYISILMLTSKSTELDRVVGLEMGADDYLTKPFSIPELLARVKSIFRQRDAFCQAATKELSPVLNVGELSINLDTRQVAAGANKLSLTVKEFDLLTHFASNPGKVYNRIQLLNQVWGYSHEGYEHTVNSHINRLRAKIEINPAEPRYILTVWGVGYKFAEG